MIKAVTSRDEERCDGLCKTSCSAAFSRGVRAHIGSPSRRALQPKNYNELEENLYSKLCLKYLDLPDVMQPKPKSPWSLGHVVIPGSAVSFLFCHILLFFTMFGQAVVRSCHGGPFFQHSLAQTVIKLQGM